MGTSPDMTEIARRELTSDQIQFIANTDLIPKAYRGNLPAIFACIATGREIGFSDLESLRLIFVVDGKPTLSAEAMVNLARKRGHSITGTSTAKAAKVTGRRADNGDEMTAEYTLEDASAAGLAGKQNWQKHPGDMLWARAVSRLCRRLFPDVFSGMAYTPGEIADDDALPFVEISDPVEVLADEPPAETTPDEPGQSVFAQMAAEVTGREPNG
jgi:hypothetical protein